MTKWIDVSDFSQWKGHLTGIQRVTYNLGKKLSERADVRYFKYLPSEKLFIEVNFSFEDYRYNQEVEGLKPELGLRGKFIEKVPTYIKNRLSPGHKKILKFVARKSISASKAVLYRARSIHASKIIAADFEKNDTIYVLGNAWDRSSLMGDLGKIKTTKGIKIVNVVYDLIPIFQPHLFGNMLTRQYVDYIFEAINHSDLLLAISENTKRDVLRYCKETELPLPNIEVIRLGDDIDTNSKPVQPIGISDNFILCIGTIEIRKNHTLLYYAYKLLIDRGIDVPKLVIVGKRGWYVNDTLMLFEHDPEIKDKIIILEGATDAEVNWLYDNCLFTVYPSIYEGWGLPITESLARHKPVLCSSSSSMTEAGGKLAVYFSPYNSQALADALDLMLNDEKYARKVSDKAKQYNIYSWDDSFTTFYNFIKSSGLN